MKENPKISVIIPVYNGERFISEALYSVIRQNYHPIEIIVIDDGSTDKTADIVNDFEGNIRYHNQNKSGIAAARNKGISLAEGELISFIDADDVWLPDKLKLQTDLLNQNPETEIVIGFMLPLAFENMDQVTNEQIACGKSVLALQMGSTLIRKSVFKKTGGFDTELIIAEDSDWFYRIMEAGINVHVMPETVQLYRQHSNNITKDKDRTTSYMMKAFKKSLDRRRKAGVSTKKPLPAFGNIEQVKLFWQKKQK